VIHDEHDNPVLRALRALDAPRVVAAVSGGADSMAMLHSLCALARERDVHVVAAHFDHRLRRHSGIDRDLVRQTADLYGARVVTGAGDVAAHALTTRQSVEAAARELRYAFLERTADEAGADVITTAHTRDDQVETVLMRIRRGAGARGRRGILARRGRVVRPMLEVRRADTRAYCIARQVPFVDDPSNLSFRFERNRMRHEALPELRRAFPDLELSLLKIAQLADIEFERVERIAGPRVRKFLRSETAGRWVLDVNAFSELDHDDCLHLANAVLEEMDARTDVSTLHHEMLFDLIAADAGTISYLPGLRVRREHDGIVFEDPQHVLPRNEIARALEAPGTLDVDGWHLEAHRVEPPHTGEFSNSESEIAYIPCDDTMVVRYPREGDRIQPFGMDGHKKLSDVFIDRKIPKRMRATTPVVEVDGEIVWIVGVVTSERCRIGQQTSSIVKLTATRSQP
jgi:tRNA(Ile)-lysidine synthase